MFDQARLLSSQKMSELLPKNSTLKYSRLKVQRLIHFQPNFEAPSLRVYQPISSIQVGISISLSYQIECGPWVRSTKRRVLRYFKNLHTLLSDFFCISFYETQSKFILPVGQAGKPTLSKNFWSVQRRLSFY